MPSVGVLPAIALVAGAVSGLALDVAAPAWLAAAVCLVALLAWCASRTVVTVVALGLGFSIAGLVLAADARDHALHTPLRAILDREYGGFHIDRLGPEGDHDPVRVLAVIAEDAAVQAEFMSVRARVTAVAIRDEWHSVDGGVALTVSGAVSVERASQWLAGRTIAAPVAFRRPARYLNDGVPDFERQLALGGTTLFGSVKSSLLVEVVARGSVAQEAAARVRAHVRRAVGRWIAPRDQVSAAIVTAVLIGDRTALPDEIRDRLQAAGTYHVIAISGGNIAILAGLVIGSLMIAGIRGRPAAAVTILALLAYSQVATAGPSVWRATLMAVLYLTARLFDYRTAPWHATAIAAALMTAAAPLDIRDPGFVLTFGATSALLEGARRGVALLPRHLICAWIVASITASLSAEIALLPVSASFFSRITSAGLVLNLAAVPLMSVAQIAGVAVSLLDGVEVIAAIAGWVGHGAAVMLVESARLVEVAPWLTARVPPPALVVICVYYIALGALLVGSRLVRVAAALAFAVALLMIALGLNPFRRISPEGSPQLLRLAMFDVGQSEALLLESGGEALLIDAAGRPFGGNSFDIGGRVLAPALWTRGIRSLQQLVITHGDPDHMGGAASVLRDFTPERLGYGVPVPVHQPTRDLLDAARRAGTRVHPFRAGGTFALGRARVRVLHPPEPDWERPRVRNDDSVVLEVVHGDVALLLTGDIGAAIERAILPRLTPARIRLLKVAHHGSRTSSSRLLLETWRPQFALISAGRGNTFGHPAPEVLRRLEAIGATVLRTDLHGQITIETDGRTVRTDTFVNDATGKH